MSREDAPWLPRCPICRQSVNLENSKSDEHGRAIHETCYVSMVKTTERREKATARSRY